MKAHNHRWQEDPSGTEICEICRDFRPWEETVKELRKRVETSRKESEVLSQTGIDILERANTAERKIEQMREALIVARDCIVFGSSLDKENNEACVQRALNEIDKVLDQVESITAEDAEYLRGEPVPLDIQIPIEIEEPS